MQIRCKVVSTKQTLVNAHCLFGLSDALLKYVDIPATIAKNGSESVHAEISSHLELIS